MARRKSSTAETVDGPVELSNFFIALVYFGGLLAVLAQTVRTVEQRLGQRQDAGRGGGGHGGEGLRDTHFGCDEAGERLASSSTAEGFRVQRDMPRNDEDGSASRVQPWVPWMPLCGRR